MIIEMEKVKEVLESGLTGYRARELVDITQQGFDLYKNGKSKLENMPISTAVEIMKLYDMRGSEWK